MKLRGIMLVKNEEDIIRYSLEHAAHQFDSIHIIDNGSDDRTWDRVQEVAKQFSNIKPFEKVTKAFRDGLRCLPFNAFKDDAVRGDWWCRLDGDEIYLDDPKSFLSQVAWYHHVVWSCHLNFYLTEQDLSWLNELETLESLPEFNESLHLLFYRCNFSEPRFFRHHPRLKWTEDMSWPKNMGVAAPQRIRVRHYQYRSPHQIDKRLSTRRIATDGGYVNFKKDVEAKSWRDKIFDSASMTKFESNTEVAIPCPHPNQIGFKRWLKICAHAAGVLP